MSKAVFDVSYYDDGKGHYLGQFNNNINGFEDFKKCTENASGLACESWFVCFENTGEYSKSFLEWLYSQQITCKEENAIQISKSLGIRRGKDDKIDSKAICIYCYEKKDRLVPSKPASPIIKKLKRLLARRDLLVKQRMGLQVSLSEQKSSMDTDQYEMFRDQNDALIKLQSTYIKKIENEIKATMKSNLKLKDNFDLTQSVIGIGFVTAAYLIAFTDNFKDFANARKFASYCGIAPFPNSSGIKIGKTKVSHYANKKIKSLLSNGINAAIQHDKEIRQYYERKINAGKEKGIVLNAVKNKLVQRVFAVINRQTPYVKLLNYT